MWQEIIVGICVAAAVFFLVRRWLPLGGRKKNSCGSCGNCSTGKTPPQS